MRWYWLVLGVLATLGLGTAWAHGWVWQNPLPFGNGLGTLAVPDGEDLRFFDSNGLALERIGGEWRIPQTAESYSYLWRYSFVSPLRGWVVLGEVVMPYHTRILATSDGGHSWQDQLQRPNGGLVAVHFFDEQRGWAAGSVGDRVEIWRTTNGGADWLPCALDSVDAYASSIDFISDTEGWVLAGRDLFHTTDGGVTWSHAILTRTLSSGQLDFASSRAGWILNRMPPYRDLYHTTDGGVTWEAENFTLDENQELRALRVLDENRAWVAGDDGLMWATLDGGATWTPCATHTTSDLSGLYLTPDLQGYACGMHGTVLTTTDGFEWSVVAGNPDTENLNFWDVDFFDTNIGWAAGDHLYGTTDGGATWARNTAAPRGLFGVRAVNLFEVWGLTSDTVWYSSDAGATWTAMDTPAGYEHFRWAVVDENTVWLYSRRPEDNGRQRTLLTTDGGATWSEGGLVTGGPDLMTFVAVDRLNAWIGGWTYNQGGYIQRTTDGGASWATVLRGATTINELCFLNDQLGYAGGGNPSCLRTTDGGITWTALAEDVPTDFDEIEFVDFEHGWGYGTSGCFQTTDAGESWQPVALNGASLLDMDFVDPEHGWACGAGGSILTYTPDAISAAPEPDAAVPAAPALGAYPNPFNPATTLTFDLPARMAVTLAIYNLTGRRVATLAERVFEAGSHRVAFDGSELASGIYFARLEGAGVAKTQKLVLLK